MTTSTMWRLMIAMMFDYNGNHMFFYGFIILVIIAIIVANDANSTGRNGLLWGLAVLLMPMMGLLAYLIVRSIYPAPTTLQGTTQVKTPRPPVVTPVAQPVKQPLQSFETGKDQFCTSCGSPNKVGAEFCNACGAKILHG